MKSDIICAPNVRYFDYTASALALSSIERAIASELPNYANTHSASGRNSRAMCELYARAKAKIRTALGVGSEYALIACGSGSSAAIAKFAQIMGIHTTPAAKAKIAAALLAASGAGGAAGGIYKDIARANTARAQMDDKHISIPREFYANNADFATFSNTKIRQKPFNSKNASSLNSFIRAQFKDTLVICSALEHHSNELIYREGLCDFARLSLRGASSDLFELTRRCKEFRRKRPAGRLIIAASAASNITGVRNDLRAIAAIAREHDAVFFCDATAALPYENLSVLPDAFAFSSHKFLGGCSGPGFLCIKRELIPAAPSFAAGGTVDFVDRTNAVFSADAEFREEGGTPPILGVYKASLAIAHRDMVGLSTIKERLDALKERFMKGFLQRQFRAQLIMYAQSERDRLPIFALNAARVDPYELARELANSYGIESRAGCACAGPYTHDLMKLPDGLYEHSEAFGGFGHASNMQKPGFLRVGLHYSHDEADVDYLLDALAASAIKLRNKGAQR